MARVILSRMFCCPARPLAARCLPNSYPTVLTRLLSLSLALLPSHLCAPLCQHAVLRRPRAPFVDFAALFVGMSRVVTGNDLRVLALPPASSLTAPTRSPDSSLAYLSQLRPDPRLVAYFRGFLPDGTWSLQLALQPPSLPTTHARLATPARRATPTTRQTTPARPSRQRDSDTLQTPPARRRRLVDPEVASSAAVAPPTHSVAMETSQCPGYPPQPTQSSVTRRTRQQDHEPSSSPPPSRQRPLPTPVTSSAASAARTRAESLASLMPPQISVEATIERAAATSNTNSFCYVPFLHAAAGNGRFLDRRQALRHLVVGPGERCVC